MEDNPHKDWLLGAVRLISTAFMVLSAAACMAAVIALLLMPLWWEHARLAMEARAASALPQNLAVLSGGSIALGAGASALAFQFLRLLRRIVDTVGHGDPFTPENAARLRQMGWLSVVAQILAFPAAALTSWFAHVAHSPYIDGRFSIGGILLALVLFVLARVFHKGAQMREDLDGTV